MSLPLTPFDRWASMTNQNSIPANNNSLRAEIFSTDGIADDVTAQPGSPVDGDWYIIPVGATGAQWSTFAPDSVAIFYGGTWYEFVPADGNQVLVAGVLVIYSGSGGWEPITVPAAATWGAIAGILSAQTDLQAALDAKITSLADPNADRVLFWDDSAGAYAWLAMGTNLSITGTTLNAAGGGGSSRDTVSALATSGSVGVDFSLGDYFTLALAGNVSGFTFSNLPGSGKGGSLMIRITQDTTPRTVAWPASFKWAGGTVPAVSTASGAVDVLAISTFDNGTTWDATLAKAFA